MGEYDGQSGRDMPDDSGHTPADDHIDEDDLHVGLSALAGLVAGAQSGDELSYAVAVLATYAVPDVDGASVFQIQRSDAELPIGTWAAAGDFVRDLENVQYTYVKQGPGITCMHTGRPTSADRWTATNAGHNSAPSQTIRGCTLRWPFRC